MAWKVTFDGFDTKEQAQEFAAWYGGQGEQDATPWLEEHTDLSFAETGDIVTDLEKHVVDVELKLYYKDGVN